MKFTNRLSFNRCAAVKYIIIYLNGTKSGDIRRRLINIPILLCISCWYRQITLQIVYIASLSDVTLFLYGLVELYIYNIYGWARQSQRICQSQMHFPTLEY